MKPGTQAQLTFAAGLLLALSACVVIAIEPGTPAANAPVARSTWPATASCPVPARTANDAPRLLALINAERAKAGVQALVASAAMADVAHRFACEIAARDDIAHSGSDGSTLSERLGRSGISANLVAENTASGQRTPEAVMAGWMASPHHRANILRAAARNFGLGQADGAQPYWVTDFTS